MGSLARTIANRWKNIDPVDRKHFDDLAAVEKMRYKKELEHWKKNSKRLQKRRKHVDNEVFTMPASASPNFSNSPLSTSDGTIRSSKKNESIASAPIANCGSIRMGEKPDIAELAIKLDEECIDF